VSYPWNSWRIYASLTIGLCELVLFVLWSKFVAMERILRASMFKSATALASYVGTTLHGTILWSLLYYIPLYFVATKGYGPTKSGVALFPWIATVAPAAAVVGVLVKKTGRYREFIWISWALTMMGAGLLCLFKATTLTGEWICLALVFGIGLGILYPAMSFAIQAAASNADLPFVATLYSFFRCFGQILGVAVGGTVFQNRVKRPI
jgi:MFS family permease